MSQEPHPAAPFYPALAYAPAPPKDLAAFGVIAFATAATATAFNLGTALLSGRMIRTYDDAALDWSLAAYALGGILEYVALVAGWITGSMWLHRARVNAQVLNPDAPYARSAGWAWGGWVCPVVNLWFPFQVVRDTRRAVTPSANNDLLGWWWAAYLVMTISGNVLSRYVNAAGSDEAVGVQTVSLVVAGITVGALVLWGLVLRRVTREQHARMYGGGA